MILYTTSRLLTQLLYAWGFFTLLVSGEILCNAGGATAAADELVRPQAIERNQSVEFVYRFDKPATGHGFLDIEWSDVVGRLVERRRIPLDLADAAEVAFPLDARRAVTMKNRLAAHLSIDAVDPLGNKFRREHDEAASFIVSPPDHPWSDYQIIMWQQQTRSGYAALNRLGVTAGMVLPWQLTDVTADPTAPLLDNDMSWYIENIATDFYSTYHRWSGDRPVNWRFLEVKKRYRDNPFDPEALVREPSLSDPESLAKIQDRLMRVVAAQHPYRPLYYNLGDETGIADLAAFWDFDFSEASLTGMRDWLKERYGNLSALNQEWGSEFARWEDVKPLTTREAMQRSDENFAAWADFKEWMDVAFARAIEAGTAAIHEADPEAVAAIEGGQIPGWGGYDYSRLAASVDAMEAYDPEIALSFNPRLIILIASGERGEPAEHRIWREALRGARGLILWDEKNEFVSPDGRVGERGREARHYIAELRGGLGALLINSRRHADPIGILYSPASMRVQWLLDRRASGEDWSSRDASSEWQDDAIRVATRNFTRLIEHSGLQYRFVSPEEVRRGDLGNGSYRILMLPHTIALSPIEAKKIQGFVEQSGTVVADGEPGIFDEHGRRLAKPALANLFAGSATPAAAGHAIYTIFPDDRGRESGQSILGILKAAGVEPLFPLTRVDGGRVSDVETHIFDNGKVTIIAFQRDPQSVSGSVDAVSTPSGREAVALTLPRSFYVYDLRFGQALGFIERLALELGPVDPAILGLSEKPLTPLSISGPRDANLGSNAQFFIHSDSLAAIDVVHLDLVDPEGAIIAHYSGNLSVIQGAASKFIPFALNDKPGIWTVRARDLLSGATATAELKVER